MTVEKASNIEKHIQTFLFVFLIGICTWMAKTTNDSAIDLARMSEQISNLNAQVVKLQDQSDRRYTSDDAERDHRAIERRLDSLERWKDEKK